MSDPLLDPINAALNHRADNSDAALVHRTIEDAIRMGWLSSVRDRGPRAVQVTYDDRAYWARIGPGKMKRNDCRYFATVEVNWAKGRWSGRIMELVKQG